MLGGGKVPRDVVVETLRELGCERIEGNSNVANATRWRTRGGKRFYVPEVGVDRGCPEEAFRYLERWVRYQNRGK